MSDLCRDWLKTLWRASFKGVQFWFEQDKEEGGRGLVIHEFPNRDDPYIEDLGEAPRYYSGSAYVHGEDADALANALKAALASRGAGTLVVPYFGPVTVHCQTFERSTQRDQLGYVAFELKFVRKGAASAFVSAPFLQSQAFTAADDAARLLGALFPRTINLNSGADAVIHAVTDTLAVAVASLDVMRQTYPVDPIVSARLRDALAAQYQTITADPPAAAIALIDEVRQFADATPAPAAVQATIDLATSFASLTIRGQPYLSPTLELAADNTAATSRLVRLAALIAYAEAVLRSTYGSRPEGVTARAEVAERFEQEENETFGAADAQMFVAIEALRGRVIEWLTQTINNLAPVITVESNIIRPSLDLAWILYADPFRADELVTRNAVRHPSFMPREISALSR